jgi:hypothetical protein
VNEDFNFADPHVGPIELGSEDMECHVNAMCTASGYGAPKVGWKKTFCFKDNFLKGVIQ